MAVPSLADATLSATGRIGRYFNIASMLPALFLVLWIYALLASRPWNHAPDFEAAVSRLDHTSIIEAAWMLVATLLLALFLHPLQFVITQLLEGYWGSSRLAVHIMTLRIRYHRRNRRHLEERIESLAETWQNLADDILDKRYRESERLGKTRAADNPEKWDENTTVQNREQIVVSKQGDGLMVHVAGEQAAHAELTNNYPEADRILPTRLGNTLRAFEDSAGKQYGLDAITTAPHFYLIAPDRHMQYLRDTREQLETAVKLCTVSLLAALITSMVLLTGGLWLLIALVPYSLAYVGYRASIAAAQEYAAAMRTVIDLNRFALYDALRVKHPKRTKQERITNERLMDLLQGSDEISLRYSDSDNADLDIAP